MSKKLRKYSYAVKPLGSPIPRGEVILGGRVGRELKASNCPRLALFLPVPLACSIDVDDMGRGVFELSVCGKSVGTLFESVYEANWEVKDVGQEWSE